jgi:trehalose/maltose hydrolase-like predicted phosphorylase
MSDAWVLTYDGFDPSQEALREALCALGNGRFVTRGAAEEADAGDAHYPGTYIAGGYNRLASEVAGRSVANEDLVNFPNWLPLTFRAEDGDWLDAGKVEILEQQWRLDMREAVLHRRLRVRDAQGRETTVISRRIVSMRCGRLAAIDYRITPENWDGAIRIRSELDGSVTNAGVARYRQLANHHLEVLEAGTAAAEGVFLLVQTRQSRFLVALAARGRIRWCTVSMAEQQRRTGGNPAVAPEPAVRTVGCGLESPAAARECGHCLQHLAILAGDGRPGFHGDVRRRDAPRDCALLVQQRALERAACALRDPGRDGAG